MGNGAPGNEAGSAAAGRNSLQNPSGNQLLNNNSPGAGAPAGAPSSGTKR
ncbi:MAG: hypothetical protein JO141_32395 [Bradyrhizobium sp.]|nr:hypothetical protein [Bradyrhizobium sp.]